MAVVADQTTFRDKVTAERAGQPAEVLFVRVPVGKGWRYQLAGGSEIGPRFKRVMKGKRAVYERVQ